MKIDRFFESTDRYKFDFSLCTPEKGYAQVDTGQDAWYFGTWANPTELKIVNYCEGDVTIQTAETDVEFASAIREIQIWNNLQGWKFIGIDPMLREEIANEFKRVGLGDLLH